MTLLRDTAWRLKYTPDDGDLVRLFYVPALRSANRYDRLTGYFSARALALAPHRRADSANCYAAAGSRDGALGLA